MHREWFEDEEFWSAYAPLMFDEERWAETPAVIDAIEKLASPQAGAWVLDACCGPGRHSLELAARGYKVTGIDLSEPYLEAARESAEAWDLAIEFVRADVRHFERPRCFDLALNLYTSFGYFENADDDILFLRRLRASLKPGGTLVLETRGKETTARDFVEDEWFERGGMTILTSYRIVGDWEGLLNRWVILPRQERAAMIDRSFVIRLYSAWEMKRALSLAGFSKIQIFGDLDGRPYDEKAQSLVALARTDPVPSKLQ